MGFLDGIEKLINKHGSATVLRERIDLLNGKYVAVQNQVVALQQQVTNLQVENERLKLDKSYLQKQIRISETGGANNTNPAGEVCGHCGNQNLKPAEDRSGSDFEDPDTRQALFNLQ